ncbi:hypothetical protein WMY93_012784 [Mugilogobius chulae]|uniref:Uncharacterized protein n=1 Tax=Mugilogobius chulae TaxID=88201 RepID=A0AAW0NYI0_9GOBI
MSFSVTGDEAKPAWRTRSLGCRGINCTVPTQLSQQASTVKSPDAQTSCIVGPGYFPEADAGAAQLTLARTEQSQTEIFRTIQSSPAAFPLRLSSFPSRCSDLFDHPCQDEVMNSAAEELCTFHLTCEQRQSTAQTDVQTLEMCDTPQQDYSDQESECEGFILSRPAE